MITPKPDSRPLRQFNWGYQPTTAAQKLRLFSFQQLPTLSPHYNPGISIPCPLKALGSHLTFTSCAPPASLLLLLLASSSVPLSCSLSPITEAINLFTSIRTAAAARHTRPRRSKYHHTAAIHVYPRLLDDNEQSVDIASRKNNLTTVRPL